MEIKQYKSISYGIIFFLFFTLGSENLLVIMWPESFGAFTFDLGPLFQALLWSLMYNAYGTLKLVSEVRFLM